MTIGAVSDIARAVESQGHDFYTWADWYPGGHPDTRWTKKVLQAFPSTRHWVHHSVTSATADPAHAARTINDIGIQRYGKMSYSFLVHSSGAVIQGCYPYIGAHTKNYNSTSLAGCNIGNYEELVPSSAMLDGNVALIRALMMTGHYPWPIEIRGHRQSQYAQTECPGDYLMARLPDIATRANAPLPTPQPPVTPAKDDAMFAYEYLIPGSTTLALIHVAGGKQTRIDGQTATTRIKSTDWYIGEIGKTLYDRYTKQYGEPLGMP